MLSLNVPVPGTVRRLAASLKPALATFDVVRERHSLVLKRFEADAHAPLDSAVRRALRGLPAFEARVTGLDTFPGPVSGPAPVVYLAVESPGLIDCHRRLVESFGAVEGLEADAYVPHITLARGSSSHVAKRLVDRSIDPITWTVSELEFWNAHHREPVGRVGLPS